MQATKMRITKTLAVIGIALLMAAGCDGEGCPTPFAPGVVSIHPLFEERDLRFEPLLLGSWSGDNQDEKGTFRKAGEKGYELVITKIEKDPATKEEPSESYTVRLVELAGQRFLDWSSRYSRLGSIPGHLFFKFQLDEDVLRLTLLDDTWLEHKVVDQRFLTYAQASCGTQKGPVVLTASTRELQNLVLSHAQDAAVFKEEIKLRRMQEPESALEK